jgi:hypothetical protein
VPQTRQLAADPPVAPGLVVAGHLQHEPADRRAITRPSSCPARIRPAALNQIGVPAQECPRSDNQGQLAAVRGGKPPGEGGQHRPVGLGDLTWRCRTAIWWRSTMISAFLTSSERVAGPASTAARRSGKAGGRSRELIVPQSRPAPLLSPETSPRPVGEQESQLRGGWHDFRHPQGPGRPDGAAPQPRAAAPRSPRPSRYRCARGAPASRTT